MLQDNDPDLTFADTSRLFREVIINPGGFGRVVTVFGKAGGGKTHYIRQQLAESPTMLTIAVNEAFTPLNAIKSLNKLSADAIECALFFNFTINPRHADVEKEEEQRKIMELLDTIGWFFYHLLVLGYVEDPATGTSYRLPGGQNWTIYVEVPSFDDSHRSEESLQFFNVEIPTLGLLGSCHEIEPNAPFTVDGDVQLVCKYLKAYEIGGVQGIDQLYTEGL